MSKDNFTDKGVAPYGMRHGSISPKGKGFFGDLKRPDGDSSTELSSEFEYEGKKVEYPLIVPTLSKAELDILLKGEKPTDDIYDKAESWAKFRINKGMSPFASSTGNEKFPAPEASNKFAEGGMASNDMNRLFAEGGMNDEGGTVDPVSGNDVPPGSLQNEVRDDIDAKLSEGEFVVPADVVRYIGLERLMKLRDEAKAGLARMDEIGQMGNAEEVANPEALHEDEEGFESEIDDIMQEVDGEEMGEKKFAAGGFATPGADLLSKYNIPRTSLTNPALDVRAYKNADGRVMYITFFNDRPSIAIPQGYSYVSSASQLLSETKTETTKINAPSTTTIVEQGGDGGVGTGGGGPSVGTGSGVSGASSASVGNSPVGIAIGAIANAIESITNPNAVVSIAEDTLSVDAQGNTVSAANSAAAANAAAVAASNAADASDNGVVGSTDATAAADNSGNTSGDTGDSGDGSGDGVGVGDFAKGGLVAKRTKKPTPARKKGIASKR